jgi:predicted phosphoribosyltransferase
MHKYPDRQAAGKMLAPYLKAYANCKEVLVLGLPRGGVPIAYEIALSLSAPLDVLIVRKLGVPWQKELAMGAIASNGIVFLNKEILNNLHISQAEINKTMEAEINELARREKVYRGNRSPLQLTNHIIILVDDGIATGATMIAAIEAVRQQKPKRIVVAVPVATPASCEEINSLVEEIVCPLQPDNLYAVGAWYDEFSETSDEEVRLLLDQNTEKKNENK